MQLDLGNEKALSNKAESARSSLEKQNRELKVRLSELEEMSRKGNKNQVTTLEQKVCFITCIVILISFNNSPEEIVCILCVIFLHKYTILSLTSVLIYAASNLLR